MGNNKYINCCKFNENYRGSRAEATAEVVMAFCKEEHTANEIMQYIGLKHKAYFRKDILKPLLEKGLLLMTIPDKPTSSKQKYYAKK